MSNNLSNEKKIAAVSMLCEGNSIRSIERMTGIHRDTVMRLGVRMGEGCKQIMHEKFRALDCKVTGPQPPLKLTLCLWQRNAGSFIGSCSAISVSGCFPRRGLSVRATGTFSG